MKTKNAFAKALKSARKARGLTQEDFSLVSSRTYLSTLERGLKSPTLEKIEMLAETLDVHPLTLLTLTYLNASPRNSLDSLFKKVTRELKDIED